MIVSHLLVKLLCNGFAACARVHTAVWPLGPGRASAASESVKVALSAASRKATGRREVARLGRRSTGDKLCRCVRSGVTLDAPAVTLGVFECALHLFPKNLREDG